MIVLYLNSRINIAFAKSDKTRSKLMSNEINVKQPLLVDDILFSDIIRNMSVIQNVSFIILKFNKRHISCKL